jgi:hypothetical protein
MKRRKRLHFILHLLSLACILVWHSCPAQEDLGPALQPHGFSIHGYGIGTYQSFTWQTDPERRDRIDMERLVLYPSTPLSDRISVHAEIEFEHGGTGSTMEFDRFEEFGRFVSYPDSHHFHPSCDPRAIGSKDPSLQRHAAARHG